MNVRATLRAVARAQQRLTGPSKSIAVQRSECVPWAIALGNPF